MAEDAVQDGFERAFRNLSQFEIGRPFGPWLHRIVVNRALTLASQRPMHSPLEEEQLQADDLIALAEETTALLEALAELKPDQRELVVLRLVLGYTPSEVAAMQGVPEGTVHSRLSRALCRLRESLEVPDGI